MRTHLDAYPASGREHLVTARERRYTLPDGADRFGLLRNYRMQFQRVHRTCNNTIATAGAVVGLDLHSKYHNHTPAMIDYRIDYQKSGGSI
jgi:hypothetical protein|nr:hypothetical protein [Methanoregula boonei]